MWFRQRGTLRKVNPCEGVLCSCSSPCRQQRALNSQTVPFAPAAITNPEKVNTLCSHSVQTIYTNSDTSPYFFYWTANRQRMKDKEENETRKRDRAWKRPCIQHIDLDKYTIMHRRILQRYVCKQLQRASIRTRHEGISPPSALLLWCFRETWQRFCCYNGRSVILGLVYYSFFFFFFYLHGLLIFILSKRKNLDAKPSSVWASRKCAKLIILSDRPSTS